MTNQEINDKIEQLQKQIDELKLEKKKNPGSAKVFEEERAYYREKYMIWKNEFKNKAYDVYCQIFGWAYPDLVDYNSFETLRHNAVKEVTNGRTKKAKELKNEDEVKAAKGYLKHSIDNWFESGKEEKKVTKRFVNLNVGCKMDDLGWTEREIYQLKDEKELFYKLMKDAIDQMYEEYRIAEVENLISIPFYEDTEHMSRWRIYSKEDVIGLNAEVKERLNYLWNALKVRAITQVTDRRIYGIVDKHGRIQVSKTELEEIRKLIKRMIYNYVNKE